MALNLDHFNVFSCGSESSGSHHVAVLGAKPSLFFLAFYLKSLAKPHIKN